MLSARIRATCAGQPCAMGFNKVGGLCRSRAPLNDVMQVAHSYFAIFGHADAFKLQGRLAAALHQAGYGAAIPKKLHEKRFPV